MGEDDSAIRSDSEMLAERGGDNTHLGVGVFVRDIVELDQRVKYRETNIVLQQESSHPARLGRSDRDLVSLVTGDNQRPINA